MKKLKRPTKAKLNKELKRLRNKCLSLWKIKVKERAGNMCENCHETKMINAHHIENYRTNKGLRYDIRNGVAFCPTCHKFGSHSAHNSFCAMHLFMIHKRNSDLNYLLQTYIANAYINPDRKYLLAKIKELESS